MFVCVWSHIHVRICVNLCGVFEICLLYVCVGVFMCAFVRCVNAHVSICVSVYVSICLVFVYACVQLFVIVCV